MNPSTALGRVLVDELIHAGVTDVVLCAGSRNAPLSLAVSDAERDGRLRLHVRLDERTAGFLALGLARATGRPAAVVTTSGSAVVNLHPAVVEAHHDGVALVLLTADRPPWLRGVGANQVIDQRSVFGAELRFFTEFAVAGRQAGQVAGWRATVDRAVAQARGAGGRPGPVQLNVPLSEPLLPDLDDGTEAWPEPLSGNPRRPGVWTELRFESTSDVFDREPAVPAAEPGEKVLYIAALTSSWAARVARAGGLVISEAGGLAGPDVIPGGVAVLDAGVPAELRPDRVIVLGRPTLFRGVSRLLADSAVVVDVVGDPSWYPDPAARARVVAPGLPSPTPSPPAWAGAWRAAGRAAVAAQERVLAEVADGPIASARLARELTRVLPADSTLLLGSSQPPRDIGRFAVVRPDIRVVANRGVAGIDGLVSTAVGVALGTDGPTVALLGDLTLLHDHTGLMIGPLDRRPDLAIVISSNDGGAIFGGLESGDEQHAHAFERVFGTPHGVSIRELAAATGCDYRSVEAAAGDDLAVALADALDGVRGIRIVEVPTGRADVRGLSRRTSAEVGDAVREALPSAGMRTSPSRAEG
ncbi:2-succinyl-5-enolpyruvyl-6-hydroxy-3-cyclohexene-1-carboxylic-acid synthase [Nakamurella flava]|uniref:2-succinyl-5-enolpyruvyl-6-hydroxy-3-cyclohexene-1-carboxylate synthase n=1 Tax=Nakamurella flava TaxID=2576308 RepID=A0A4U6QEP2_9ACTN|nr:2-succinyl-5-enolpyruvyl-6-hydroxy-3-cyclohexene-1-carboxylic-acid synthase [Nakamurella flava]TKV58590.1 2-succinyl-5-enolpyruvyl-6-hydroxy-3-cyclohexene-1-carboxylic-acid synthase [Nakamurella flava]